ncbi:aspartyl/asparaginyl beta-hydroxylase domain-containing protein [Yunchengibacter salinarum]|uniref:aspartyl/asparaginyl beta-hydroxylase domain-containing protein n=1 Tax=Yunchengibacter salinarum TaxID=3133399 RepID=UPI0035B68299
MTSPGERQSGAQAPLADLIRQANDAARRGDEAGAAALHRRIVARQPDRGESWQFLSAAAFRGGDHAGAAAAIRGYLKAYPLDGAGWRSLGQALLRAGQADAAWNALKTALSLTPSDRTLAVYAGEAARAAGARDHAASLLSLALEGLAPETLDRVRREGEPALSHAVAEAAPFLHRYLKDRIVACAPKGCRDAAGGLTGALAGAEWRQGLPEEVWADDPHGRRPAQFFLPALPARPWVAGEELTGMDDLVAAFPAIVAEVRAALDPGAAAPYVAAHLGKDARWSDLAGREDWGALHLYNNANATPLAERFPRTLEALEGLDLYRLNGAPVEVFFSLLAPNTTIPPHYGTNNARLTVHLPIIVPDGCHVTVAEERRPVAAGAPLAFDDTFLHSAANEGGDRRVTLIFEVWHPGLSAAEKQAVMTAAEDYDAWRRARSESLAFLGASLEGAAAAEQDWRRARKALAEGQAAAAHQSLDRALSHNPSFAPALADAVDRAFNGGDHATGLDLLQRLAENGPDHAATWYRLAVVEEQVGTRQGAIRAYGRALRLDPKNALTRLYAGAYLHEGAAGQAAEQRAGLALMSEARDLDPRFARPAEMPGVAEETRRRAALADGLLRRHFTDLHHAALDSLVAAGTSATALDRLRRAVWPQTHDHERYGPVRFAHADQRPHVFYIPDLAPITFAERRHMPWAETVEAASGAVKAEVTRALTTLERAGRPYLEAGMGLDESFAHLEGSLNWTALDLYRGGQPNPEVLDLLPETDAVLRRMPLVRRGDHPLEVFLSLLRPGQHIPPHYGLANSRLTVHLPLIVPERCRIRVGDRWRSWHEGEILAFDDSFDHEARNDSDRLRIVLIAEAWHPDLTDDEIRGVETVFAWRQDWLDQRSEHVGAVPGLGSVDEGGGNAGKE